MRKILVVSLCFCLIGCATWPSGISKTRDKLLEIEIGMSKNEVITIMGRPYKREAYTISEGATMEFLIYLTEYTYSGRIPDEDTTPICFLNGEVNGWGRNFYHQQKKQYEIEVK